MIDNTDASPFIARCEQWLCDGYTTDIRYIATEAAGERRLFDALVLLNPLPSTVDNSLMLSVPPLFAGQEQVPPSSKASLLETLRGAVAGSVTVHDQEFRLPNDNGLRFQGTTIDQNTWFMPLTLQVLGAACGALLDREALDGALRAATPPFDGADDLCTWLGLHVPNSSSLGRITVVINPPVDILVDRSTLSGGDLHLVLHAHPNADRSQVRIAVREVPGQGLSGRTQVADKIVWGSVSEGRVEGIADYTLTNATAALVMLVIGSDTVRRHWFLDPAKASNLRFAAVQQFDPDLRMIRRGLFEDTDSSRFEAAIAALLFILGFSPSLQLEMDAPDLVVATPLGRLVLVECTTRIADVATKIGKLVDRREALQSRLRANGAGTEVTAALISRQPRGQIAAQAADMRAMRILLASAEDLNDAITRAQLVNNPDEILDQALGTLNT